MIKSLPLCHLPFESVIFPLGSVRQLTDAGGAVTLARNYDPFGNEVSSVGSTTTIYGFTGEQHDSVTGMVYLRARYYNQSDGRFTTGDSWGGDDKQPMSFNSWIYVFENPINLFDSTGRNPINCYNPVGDAQDINCARPIPPRIAVDADHHNPLVNPWNITYVGQNLASPNIEGSVNDLQQQLIWNSAERDWPVDPNCSGAYHCGLCGLISVAAILNSVYPGRIKANDVVDDFIDYNEYFNTYRQQSGEIWPDAQFMLELHDFINLSYSASLYAHGEDSGAMPNKVENWLSQGNYAIAGAKVRGYTGFINTLGGANHWFVITGISSQWDTPWQDPEPLPNGASHESPWQWVRIYNPFSNTTEYYPWRFFKPAHEGFKHVMEVDRYPRNFTKAGIHALMGNCGLPDFIKRSLK